ncbi:MAG TPA: hypothetical protein VLK84_11825 [Longimicrobium sp.]|nr:hypothetical protein [Longimicrobium sp.]
MIPCRRRKPTAEPAATAVPPRRRRRAEGTGDGSWPGADPSLGPSLYLDQLAFWDVVTDPRQRGGPPGGPLFQAAGAEVRRIPAAGSKPLIGEFFARHHYTAGAGMRGLAFGLYRGPSLLGVAVFSRVCRPRWAAENFHLLPSDRARSAVQRRHLSVTEAEYAVLSRLALTPDESDGGPLGKGAASWFLARCLAGLEARNRALWSAHQRLAQGRVLDPAHLRLLRESEGADRGRGRGFIKGVATWADPYEAMLGRIYQLLACHYSGRTNRGGWTREKVGLRSGRRLSARTLAKARAASEHGHAQAALRLAWEGGSVSIRVAAGACTTAYGAEWIRGATADDNASEPEIAAALDRAWQEWRRAHVPAGATVELHYAPGTGIRVQRFPPKHAYFTALGAPWYRRQTEIRYRPLTERLLAEEAARSGGRRLDRRLQFYPTAIPPHELRPELRPRDPTPLIEDI